MTSRNDHLQTNKICSKCHKSYPTTIEYFPCNPRVKSGLLCWCKKCKKANNKRWYEKNREKIATRDKRLYAESNERRERIQRAGKKWAAENRERKRLADKRWCEENREKKAEASKRWYAINCEKAKEASNKWRLEQPERTASNLKKWREENRDRHCAHRAKRRATKLHATPSWLTEDQNQQIQMFYKEAARLTEETGIKHHVDHIIPLQGENVRGLHVPWNLQVLSATENLSKGNSFQE